MNLDQIALLLDGVAIGVLGQAFADAWRYDKAVREATAKLHASNERIRLASDRLDRAAEKLKERP